MAKNVRPRQVAQQINDELKAKYKIPSWAGYAPSGTHLNVMKGERLVEKLIIDEKKCFYFGRNSDSCDFLTEHASCSRVHAVLMYHKHLKRHFVMDLGSMHGSYIGKLRLDGFKPTPIPFDTSFHFGASTRHYILKEKPQIPTQEGKPEEEGVFDLPVVEEELENLTEFNTAHNKRVTQLPVEEPAKFPRRKRKSVVWAEREEVINPEDIDSSIGRFRNMVSVEIIPNKRKRESTGLVSNAPETPKKHVQEFYNKGLYEDVENFVSDLTKSSSGTSSIPGRVSSFVPNLAPDVEDEPMTISPSKTSPEKAAAKAAALAAAETPPSGKQTDIKPRKKYIKEAWPGKRPGPALLI